MQFKKRILASWMMMSLFIGASIPFSNAVIADKIPQIVLGSDFEDGSLQGWKARIGHEKLSLSKQEANIGSGSMLVEGRKRTYNGPMLDIRKQLLPNKEYEISAYIKLKEKPAKDITMQLTVYKNSGASSWSPLKQMTIKKEEWQQWHELKGTFLHGDTPSELKLYLETPYITDDTVDTTAFYVDDVSIAVISDMAIEDNIPAIKEVYKDDFAIGAAVYPWQMEGIYGDLLEKHFNSLTATYEMKPKFLAPKQGQYAFAAADRYVRFAEANDMVVRGHALIWHTDAAEWMYWDNNGKPASRTLALQRMKQYIEKVMKRYKGKVYAWDVVNEAIADTGGDKNGLRQTSWYKTIGPDYIDKAFEFARAADPTAKLYYNDYGTETPQKRQQIYQLLKRLKSKGLIDGVGLQSHYKLESPSTPEIEKTIKLYAGLGLDIQITELDIDTRISFGTAMPEAIAVQQAYRYKELLGLYKKYSKSISSVTFWGVQDEKTYNNQALLFDTELQAKPAYWGVADSSQLPSDPQSRTVALRASPKVQQSVDQIWDQAVSSQLTQTGSEMSSFKTLWDGTNLYVQVIVADKTRDDADQVELYVQENGQKGRDNGLEVRRLSFPRLNHQKGSYSYVTRALSTGYIVETVIPWKAIKGANGREIGFEVKIIDGASGASEPIYWNDSAWPSDSVSKLGAVWLADMPK
ncbi:endo-1,4-beta-xylanase [Paenibacillus sp. FSL H8-0537]|uniref:endo-1,4-beta-xylanase n=1 Tax=Paenibacillus sp. FSL H8-0537 TaxID=2921399 RepID=UPI003101A54F